MSIENFYFELSEMLRDVLPQNFDVENIIYDLKRQKKDKEIEKLSNVEKQRLMVSIWRDFQKSRVQAGKLVGVSGAQNIGEGITQETFKSFSRTSTLEGKVSYAGLPRITEILRISKSAKDSSMIIVFNKPYRDHEIRGVMNKMVYTVLSDVVKKREILSFQQEEWHTLYRKIYGEFENPEYVLRLNLDLDVLFVKKISPNEIARKIKEEIPSIDFIVSPIHLGFVDVFLSGVTASNVKLEIDVWGEIAGISLGGIYGIRKVYPSFINIKKGIDHKSGISSESLNEEEQDNYHKFNVIEEELIYRDPIISISDITKEFKRKQKKLYLDKDKVKYYNPSIDQILDLLREYEPKLSSGVVEFSRDIDEKDIDIILDKKILSLSIQDMINHWYIETEGTNLYDIWRLENVESSKTTSNDISEIYRILGVEASRQLLFDELYANGVRNSPHLSLLCDTMSVSGILVPVDKRGLIRQDTGVFSHINFEENTKYILQSASTGESDNIGGVTASIVVGTLANIGSGSVKLVSDARYLDAIGTQIK